MKPKVPTGYFIFSTLILIFSFALGVLIGKTNPQTSQLVLSQLQDKFSPIAGYSPFQIFVYIFLNNAVINFISIITFFLFGLIPIIILCSNGIVIGIVLEFSIHRLTYKELVATLLPHGIIEIPTFILSSSLGIWLSIELIKKIFLGKPFKSSFYYTIKTYFKWILPLTLIAAFIEAFITPLISALFKQ